MFFTINASKSLLGLDEVFRLKRDEIWQAQEDYKSFNEQDMLFNNIHEAMRWLKKHRILTINGERVDAFPEAYNLGNYDRFEIEIICHRNSRPKHLFTYEEMIEKILKADDNFNNSPQINFNGEFIIKALNDAETPVNLFDYAVRSETFCAGNGYVGSIKDEDIYKELYLDLLDNWLCHLQTGISQYSGEEFTDKSEDELIEEIEKEYKVLDK